MRCSLALRLMNIKHDQQQRMMTAGRTDFESRVLRQERGDGYEGHTRVSKLNHGKITPDRRLAWPFGFIRIGLLKGLSNCLPPNDLSLRIRSSSAFWINDPVLCLSLAELGEK